MQYIYQILLPNEKSYIGITNNPKRRHSVGKFGPTFKSYAETHPIMYKDMLIFGLDSVVVNILGEVETREEAEELEGYWISRLNTTDHTKGYNHVTSGLNNSHVVDPYYKTDEYQKELQTAIDLIERYAGIRVSYQRDYHRRNHLKLIHEKKELYKSNQSKKKSGESSKYDTSNIDIEQKKKRALETRALIDKETRKRFLEELED